MRNFTRLTGLLLTLCAAANVALAQDSALTPEGKALRGLPGVSVIIDNASTVTRPINVPPETPSPNELQAHVENRLRQAGIKVLAAQEASEGAQPWPALHFNLMGYKDKRGTNYHTLRLWLQQTVVLARDPSVKLEAPTWENFSSGTGGGVGYYQNVIDDLLNQFIRDFLDANVRGRKRTPMEESGEPPPFFKPRPNCNPARDTPQTALNAALFQAADRGDAAQVELWLARGADVNAHDPACWTPLLSATHMGQTQLVPLLLKHGADPNVSERDTGMTPLAWTVSKGDLTAVQALLAHGGNVAATSDDGYTSLMQAASMGYADIVAELLRSGAAVNARARDDATALTCAMRDRELITERDLRAKGLKPDDKFSYQDPALRANARARHDAVIELLKRAGARP